MKELLQKELDKLEPVIRNCDWENKRVYGNWLAQTYYYVCHSTRLLGLASSYFQRDRESLHRRFASHMGEEKGHEHLSITDLKTMKMTVDHWPELSQTKAFYESQYYKIQYQNATALFGYILLLEATSVRLGPQIYKRVVEAHGKQSCNFLRIHVEEDPDHVDKALDQILVLPPQELVHIEANLTQTADIYVAMLIALKEKSAVLRLAA